jgi:hypothetical protein
MSKVLAVPEGVRFAQPPATLITALLLIVVPEVTNVTVPAPSCKTRHDMPENAVGTVTVIGLAFVNRMIFPLSEADRVRAVVASVMTDGTRGAAPRVARVVGLSALPRYERANADRFVSAVVFNPV